MSSTSSLHLSGDEIERAGQLLTALLRNYEQELPEATILPALDRTALAALLAEPFPEHGLGVERLFEEIAAKIVPNSTAVAHPRFLAYVLGPPNGIAPFAEAVAAALNQNCNFWQLSPAASVVERKVVTWLAGLIGFPDTAGGLITSGGSMATLMALSAAIHDKSAGDFRKTGLQGREAPLVIYASEQAHRCVEKAVAVLGIGLDNLRRIPVDTSFRMRIDALRSAVAMDTAAGRRPACVVATAGTVNTGAIDPIDDLATFCADENLWLHVDGAFGALFVLCERMRKALLPCGRADSIALDPHKLLFAPLEAGCLVVRDPHKLLRAFAFNAAYLDAEPDLLFTNFMDYGVQLSRGFKAFKIWCALRTFGVGAFVRAADRMLDLARYMGEGIRSSPALELLAEVTLSAVCFRFKDMDDAGNRAALDALNADGVALLGPVSVRDCFGLRACITNFRTTEADIDAILARLSEIGQKIAP